MSTSLISYILGQDYQRNRTAADVLAKANAQCKNGNQWATVDDVPWAYYMPLSEIMLGAHDTPEAQAALQKIIVGCYGLGEATDDLTIQLITLPFESAMKADGMQSDKIGAETCLLKVLVQIGEDLTLQQAKIAEQADLRIRFLLDFLCRGILRKNGESVIDTTGLDPAGDPTVDVNYPIICQWLAFIDNETAIGKAALYRLQYTRMVI